MGYPSGTFNNASSGKLQISFSGKFWSSTGGGAPGWFGGTSAGMFLRILCTAGSYETIISDTSPSNLIEIDYVGGTNLSVSMSGLARQGGSGIYFQGAENLMIRCILIKR